MGVPSFFRWLARRYPRVLANAVEEYEKILGGVTIPPDTSKPNPNGVEYDNLYLDMNGIIHPCSHPENKPAPKNEDEIMIAIFEYIDRLFTIVRPRRVLYMAIDGVAPRAKMNQQRSRRFRSARDAKKTVDLQDEIRRDLIESGLINEEEEPNEEHWDSNQITPGTPFMKKISDSLKYYINQKITNDPGWRNLIVILSDAGVPGEGEHKLMHFIRSQHSQPGYDANTRHCIHGLDADLIMLGLASHEPNFSLLREDVLLNERQDRKLQQNATKTEYYMHNPFQFLQLNVLREYLERDLKVDLPFGFDLERIIDDFVLLCFFVGNDFLPHLPTLEIREDAIVTLMEIYKKNLPNLDGYLTENGHIILSRLPPIFRDVASREDEILRHRRKKDQAIERHRRGRSLPANPNNQEWKEQLKPYDNDNEAIAARLRAALHGNPALLNAPVPKPSAKEVMKNEFKKRKDIIDEKRSQSTVDCVRLGEHGWKERYYTSKFGISMDDKEFFEKLKTHYLEGLEWVMQYYYQGCQSWKWYFPFHYAPFASEISESESVVIDFSEATEPFRPFEQLLSVLPGASAKFLPEPYANLMLHPESPIIDYYPEDFEVDLNGKKFEWQGVALLPFIEESRLFAAIEGLDAEFTEEEKKRNSRGQDIIFAHRNHPLGRIISNAINTQDTLTIDPKSTKIFGSITPIHTEISSYVQSPLVELPDITDSMCLSAIYSLPPLPPHMTKFISGLKPGLKMPERVLSDKNQRLTADAATHRTLNHHLDSNRNRYSQPYHPYDRNGRNDRNDNYNRDDRNDRNNFDPRRRNSEPRDHGRSQQDPRNNQRVDQRNDQRRDFGRPQQDPRNNNNQRFNPRDDPNERHTSNVPVSHNPVGSYGFSSETLNDLGFAGGNNTESATLSALMKGSDPQTQNNSRKRPFNFQQFAMDGCPDPKVPRLNHGNAVPHSRNLMSNPRAQAALDSISSPTPNVNQIAHQPTPYPDRQNPVQKGPDFLQQLQQLNQRISPNPQFQNLPNPQYPTQVGYNPQNQNYSQNQQRRPPAHPPARGNNNK